MARDFPTHGARSFPIDSGRDFPLIGGGSAGGGGDPDFSSVVLLLQFEGDDEDTTTTDESDSAHSITFGSLAEIDTAQFKFGSSSLLLDPSGSVNPSNAFVSAPDNADWSFGTEPLTIELFVRFADLTDTFQVLISQYLNTGNQRAWYIAYNAGDIFAFISDDGTGIAPAFSFSGTWTDVAINIWFHVALTRDASDDWRLFVEGNQKATTNSTISIHNSTDPLRIGKFRSAGFDDGPVDGWIDGVRITKGVARYTANFTPPTGPYPTS